MFRSFIFILCLVFCATFAHSAQTFTFDEFVKKIEKGEKFQFNSKDLKSAFFFHYNNKTKQMEAWSVSRKKTIIGELVFNNRGKMTVETKYGTYTSPVKIIFDEKGKLLPQIYFRFSKSDRWRSRWGEGIKAVVCEDKGKMYVVLKERFDAHKLFEVTHIKPLEQHVYWLYSKTEYKGWYHLEKEKNK